MEKKSEPIQRKIFNRYFALNISIAVLLLLAIYFIYWNHLADSAAEMLKRMTVSIANEFEMKFKRIDSLQKRILFSNKMEEIIFAGESRYADEAEKQLLYQEFEELSKLVSGPDDSDVQINYWNMNGGCAGVGQNYFIDCRKEIKEENELFQEVRSKNGEKVIVPPFSTTWKNEKVVVMSMLRWLEKQESNDAAILETQVCCDNLESLIRKNIAITEEKKENYNILICNRKGEVIYASDDMEHDMKYYKAVVDRAKKIITSESGEAKIGSTSRMFYREYSEFLDWNVWVFQNENMYMKSIWGMTFILFLFTFLIIMSVWLVTRKLTREIVSPVLDIHRKMTSLDFQALDEIEHNKPEGNIKELNELNDAFEQMCKHLKESKDKLEIAHVKEMQAKFLAMQAQMNPHFLYNILAVIKIMGKEVKSKEIVETCTQLSMMLRYISSSNSGFVTVGEEKGHTLNYLKLMKTRFQEQLEYEVNIPETMEHVIIPKLVLQPLVENSIKYATEARPPWRIQIKGWLEEKKWYLSVCDNGPGMSEAIERYLKERMEESLMQQHSEKSEIGGMGILNIYSRLALAYGKCAVFEIQNEEEGGLLIVIGGTSDE